jgi:hypothetical protein
MNIGSLPTTSENWLSKNINHNVIYPTTINTFCIYVTGLSLQFMKLLGLILRKKVSTNLRER